MFWSQTEILVIKVLNAAEPHATKWSVLWLSPQLKKKKKEK